jgi:hypothetical protein
MSALTDTLANLRDGARRALGRPSAYLQGEWERMAPRQRRGLAILLLVFVGAGGLLGTYLMFSGISDLEEGNAAMRAALADIAKHRDEYLEAKARSETQEARIGVDPPQLIADIEGAAREEQVQIAESSERPVSPAGRRYNEHDVDIKIREVDLQTLTKFLRRLETGPRLVFFTRLAIKRRYTEGEKLDVEATATAFERVHEEKSKKKAEGADNKGKKE